MGVGGDGVTSLETLFGETTWPEGLPSHLSPAAISEYFACPEKWRRKRLLGEREPSAPNLLIGNAVHASVEHIYRVKIETGELPPLAEAADAAAEGWTSAVDEAKERDGIEWGDTKPDTAKDQAVSLASAYRKCRTTEETLPLAVEESGEVSMLGVPVPVRYRVDVRTADAILDVKTVSSSTSFKSPRPDDRLKALVYIRATGLQLDWHYIKKNVKPVVATPISDPGLSLPASSIVLAVAERRMSSAAAEMLRLFTQYGPDETWPTNAPEHQWRCGYCGLRKTCPVAL